MTAPFSFDGKVVAVLGGTRGIGAAAVRLFADLGAKVAIASRKAEACEAIRAELVGAGHDAIAVAAHIGREEDCAALISATLTRFGRLDAVIANAAVNPVFAPLTELDAATWHKVIDTNLAGPWHLARHALPAIADSGGGAMVMVSSINAFLGMKGAAAYGVSKAALNQMTRQLALEWGDRGVRVNAVAPGNVPTRMTQLAYDGDPALMMEQWRQRNPLKRVIDADEIAGAFAYLAGPDGRNITGQVLTVDAGLTACRLDASYYGKPAAFVDGAGSRAV